MLIFEIAGGVVLGGVVLFFLHAMVFLWIEELQLSRHLRQLEEEQEQAKRDLGQAKRGLETGATRETWPSGLQPDPAGRQRFATR